MTGPSASSNCYAQPRYWDLAFSDETQPEADFLEAIATENGRTVPGTVLETGSGGGRQVIELARRGWQVTGLELQPECVQYSRQQLARRRLSAHILQGDMSDFQLPGRFDLAHCLVNTFRHLTSEEQARSHLKCVAQSLKPGGLYVLGLHLIPPDAVELDCERWTVKSGHTRVTTTIRVLEFSRRRRLELVRFSLKVTKANGQVIRCSADYPLRIYRSDQIRQLFRSVPEFRLRAVYDFCYDVNAPRRFDDELGDAVFVLEKC